MRANIGLDLTLGYLDDAWWDLTAALESCPLDSEYYERLKMAIDEINKCAEIIQESLEEV